MKNESIFHLVVHYLRTEEVFKATSLYSRLSLRLLNQKCKSKIEKNQEEIKNGKFGAISLYCFKDIKFHRVLIKELLIGSAYFSFRFSDQNHFAHSSIKYTL